MPKRRKVIAVFYIDTDSGEEYNQLEEETEYEESELEDNEEKNQLTA